MGLGPIEILVIEFPGSQFTGEIIPELERLIESDTISIIDGLLVKKDLNGDVTFIEFDELGINDDASKLAGVVDQLDALISDEDVEAWAAELAPGNSEAILVFEHTWAKPFRDAVVRSGGVLGANIRLGGEVVDELLAELAELSD
jgi:Family of unknown function (DUF6325)